MTCNQCEHSYHASEMSVWKPILMCLLSQRPAEEVCENFIRHHGDKDGE